MDTFPRFCWPNKTHKTIHSHKLNKWFHTKSERIRYVLFFLKPISKHSVSSNYIVIFQKQKTRIERNSHNSINSELYNKHFSLRKPEDSLQKAHDATEGPGETHYKILKHLPNTSLQSFWLFTMRYMRRANFQLIRKKQPSYLFRVLLCEQHVVLPYIQPIVIN